MFISLLLFTWWLELIRRITLTFPNVCCRDERIGVILLAGALPFVVTEFEKPDEDCWCLIGVVDWELLAVPSCTVTGYVGILVTIWENCVLSPSGPCELHDTGVTVDMPVDVPVVLLSLAALYEWWWSTIMLMMMKK